MSNFLTIQQAAERLSCSDDQIRTLIARKRLRAIDIGGGGARRCWRIVEASLDAMASPVAQTSSRKRALKPKKNWLG